MFNRTRIARAIVASLIIITISAITATAGWTEYVPFSYLSSASNTPAGETVSVAAPPYMFADNKTVCNTGTPDFATIALAVADANTAVPAGGRNYLVCAGHTETAPPTGIVLTAAGSDAANPVSFLKNGVGTNPTINAGVGTATPGSAAPDGIFSIRGADYITIDGFTFTDGNAANPATMEFGVGLFKAAAGNGANNNTVQNCTFNMQRINNAAGTAPMIEGSVGILVINSTATAATTALTPTNGGTLATNGTNSGNKFYGNTINGGNYGIGLSGYAASSGVGPAPVATTFLGDLGNDVGGTSAATGNTILNYGGGAATSPAAGIRANNQWGINISYNTIDNNNGSGVNHATTLRGIYAQAGTSASATINNNSVTVRSGATSSALTAIDNGIGSTASSNTVSINNNTIRFSYTTATSGVFSAISNSSSAATVNINSNNIQAVPATNYPSTGTVPVIVGGSPGILNITNNTVSNFSMTGASGTLRAITASTPTGLYSVTGNTIENLSYSTVGSSGSITGIYNLASATLENFNTNIIRNFSTPGTGTLNGIQNNTVTGTFQCKDNQIYNFSTSAGGAGGFSANGIIWSNATVEISGNLIYSINSTGTTGGSGGTINGIAVSGSANVSKNKIYDLSSTSSGPLVYGISITSGTTHNVFNNLIGDLRAAAANNSSSDSVRGLSVTSTATSSTINASFNTIYINATSSGASFLTSGVFHTTSTTATTAALSLRNNIIVNTSTPNGVASLTTAAFRRSSGAANNLANYASTSNNNLFYAGTPGPRNLIMDDGTSAFPQTIAAYKAGVYTAGTIAPRDSNSISENPPFLSTTGSSSNFLHISLVTPTQIESGGIAVAGITDDFDGNTRNVSTPDIGADEFAGTGLDLSPPTVTYTALANTASTSARTLTTTITDATGVPTAGAGLPVLYWKINAGAYSAVTATYIGGSTYEFTFGAGVVASDVVSYYIVAQDTAGTPNVGSAPSGGSGFTINPPAASTPPGSPSQYTIVPSISGTKTVGSGGDYATLTAAIAAINAAEVTGPVVLSLTDATYTTPAETFPLVLNANGGSSASNTITIRPAASNVASITGAAASGCLIRLNGADYVTIDGSNSGGTDRSLTLTNTSTTSPATVCVNSLGTGAGATNNTVKNTNISTGVSAATGYGISVGGSTPGTSGADNDNTTLQNNAITVATVGIYANGTASVSTGGNDNLAITGNIIDSNTTIQNQGIQVGNATGSSVAGNTVSVQSSGAFQPTAISLETGFVSSTVNGNTVTKALATNTGGYGGRGITIGTGTATSSLTIANNVIYGVNGSNWNAFGNSSSMGIAVGMIGGSTTITTTAGGLNLYYNSVSMTGSMGSGSTTAVTAALYVGSGASALDIRNNVLANTQVGTNASQKNYAIYSAVANTAYTTINYNDYFVSNTFNAGSAIPGYIGSDRLDLSAIQTGFGQNANSITSNPLFNNPLSNLQPQTGSPLLLAGTPIGGITTDIVGVTRNVTTPTIGAYENATDTSGPTITYTPFGNTTSLADRTLTATITDPSGVVATGTLRPNVYFKEPGDVTWGIRPCTNTGGDTYTCPIAYAFLPSGPIAVGDTIQYFVVAQDTVGNVSANPSAGFSAIDVDNLTTAPTTPNSYKILLEISSFPYTQDFESGVGGYGSGANGGVNDWQFGTPVGKFGGAAHSGSNAWVTKLTGLYSNGHNASVESPVFNFSGTSDPTVTFWHNFDQSADPGWDAGILEMSTDGGATWTKVDATLGTGGDFNTANSSKWYNSSSTSGPISQPKWSGLSSAYTSQVSGWIQSSTTLVGAGGLADVRLRWRFGSDSGSGQDDGWIIDDISVVAPVPNPGTIQFSAATYAGDEGTSATITATRTGGTAGAVSVTYGTSDGTALNGICGSGGDYVTSTGSLNWNAGEGGSKTFNVTLCSDLLTSEGAETVNLALTSPTGGATLGAQNTAVLTINDIGITYCDTNPIAINDGVAGTYPSTINVSSLSGTINTVKVKLNNISHTYGSDIDILLVGPNGEKYVLMSDALGSSTTTNATITLADSAAAGLPSSPLSTGTYSYKPTNYTSGDTFAAPAPAGPYQEAASAGSATFASVFGGANPNGNWSLYVYDDGSGDTGSIAGGWCLEFTLTPPSPGTVQLSPSSYTPNENSVQTITATRTGGVAGAVSVDYATGGGTATAGTCGTDDYVSANGTLNWADGEGGAKTFNVTICPDAVSDPGETIDITLSNATGGVTIGGTNPGLITITDVPPPLSGTYTVGSGGNYPSLTNTGGIFEALNQSGVSGQVFINIISDLSGETGTHQLNDVTGGNNLTIRPSGGPWTITGSSAGSLIVLNGADNVVIDGSGTDANAGPIVGGDATLRKLTITNTNTGTASAVVSIHTGTNGATNNVIKNINVVGSGSTGGTLVGIEITGNTVGTVGADNDNNRITNCSVKKALYGIAALGASAANPNSQNYFNRNDLSATGADSIGRIGFYVLNIDGLEVQENSVGGISNALSSDSIGLGIGTQAVTTSSSTSGNITNGTISRNRINGVVNTNTYSAIGIAAACTSCTLANNMVTGVVSDGTSGDFTAGIFVVSGTGTSTNVFHNSVAMTGDRGSSAEYPSYAMAITGTDTPVAMVNNAFYTSQVATGALSSAKSYAIGIVANNINFLAEGNAYWSVGANDGGFRTGSLTTTGNTDLATLAAWQAAISDDAIAQEVDPQFADPTNDLHLINPATNTLLNAGFNNQSPSVDFDNDPRPTTAPPQTNLPHADIGADEVVQAEGGVIPAGTFYNAYFNGGDTLAGNVTVTNKLYLNGINVLGANVLTLGCNASVSGAGATSFIDGAVKKDFCATGAFEFPVGQNQYSKVGVTITALGTNPSSLTVTPWDATLGGFPPATSLSRNWNLEETGDLTADLLFYYDDADVNGTESDYRAYKRAGNGVVSDMCGGPCVDTVNNVLGPIVGVSTFSRWTGAGPLAPTAADVSLSGRVTTADGRGVTNAVIVLTGNSLPQPMMVKTGSFGYYRFENLEAGETYVVTVNSKRFIFSVPSRVVSVPDNVSNIDFVAMPE